jgi:DNA-directed RNA polymerase II subunit RPB2
VISAYFEDKGLVRQQLDSFNDFINTSLQDIVDENAVITVTPQNQHLPGSQVEEEEETKEYQVRPCVMCVNGREGRDCTG